MNVYISLPISKAEWCRERAEAVRQMVERRGHRAVTPFDVCDPDLPFAQRMGRRAEALLRCDAIFRCSGWSGSMACIAESSLAKACEKKIIDHISELNEKKPKEP